MSEQEMQGAGEAAVEDQDLLTSILDSFTENQQGRVKDEIGEFISAITEGETISDSALKAIDAAIAQIDEVISAQLNEVMHSAEFQKVEGTWRGLKYLVSQSSINMNLKIKVFNVSKKDLLKDLQNVS